MIACSGVKGSGKDAAASMFQYCLSVPKIFRQYWLYKLVGRIIPKKWKVLAFADPLKRMLAILLNVPIERFNDRSFKEDYSIDLNTLEYGLVSLQKDKKFLSDSKFTKMAKNLDPELKNYNLTIRQLLQYFGTEIAQTFFSKNVWINSTLKHAHDKTIIADCRFIAEAEAIKKNQGMIFYIDRPGIGFGHHQSEKEMHQMLTNGYYDHIIPNNGTLEDLFNQVKQVCA